MKINKAVGFCMAFVTMVMMAVSVHAATYSVQSELSEDKSTVTMTFNIAPNEGETSTTLNGYCVQLAYDSDVLQPVSTGVEDATGAEMYAANLIEDGVTVADIIDNATGDDVVAVGWANNTAVSISSDGLNVAKVTFNVLDQVDTSVKVDVLALATDESTLDSSNITDTEEAVGTVKFSAGLLLGDANDNGGIDLADVSSIINYYLLVQTPTDRQLSNSDFDENGKVDASDVSKVINLYLGIDN